MLSSLVHLALAPALFAPGVAELDWPVAPPLEFRMASMDTSLSLRLASIYESSPGEAVSPLHVELNKDAQTLSFSSTAEPPVSISQAVRASVQFALSSSLAMGGFAGLSLEDRPDRRATDVPGLVLAGGSGASPVAIALADARAGLWQGETGDLGAAMMVGYKFSWWGNEAAFVAGARVTRPDFYKGRENTDLSFKTLELMPFFGIRVRF